MLPPDQIEDVMDEVEMALTQMNSEPVLRFLEYVKKTWTGPAAIHPKEIVRGFVNLLCMAEGALLIFSVITVESPHKRWATDNKLCWRLAQQVEQAHRRSPDLVRTH